MEYQVLTDKARSGCLQFPFLAQSERDLFFCHLLTSAFLVLYLSGEDPRFYKRRVKQYPARLSGGFQSPTEINAPRGCAGIRFGRCQLTLTRIPRQFSRARIESRTPRRSCRDVRGASAPSTAHVCDPPDENPGACVRGSCASRRLLFYKPVTLIMGN